MKTSIKQAIKGRNTFDLSSTHLTTMDFGSIQPTLFLEVVPNDTMHIKASSFARLAPLAVPVFGSIKCYSRCFFVPMRALWSGFKDWYSRTLDSGLASSIPQISNSDFCDFFTNPANKLTELVTVDSSYSSSVPCDFSVSSTNGSTRYFLFTSKGRWFQKIINSLGYSVNWIYGANFNDGGQSIYDGQSFSLLPLLAYLRVMYDYVYPSEYVAQLSVGRLFEERSYVTPSHVLQALLDLTVAPYRKDYFTSAWLDFQRKGLSDNPFISYRQFVYGDRKIGAIDGAIGQDNGGGNAFREWYGSGPAATVLSSVQNASANEQNSITQMGLRILRSVSDFMIRNNVAGSRYFEQIAARFGVKSYKVDPDRSQYLTSFIDEVSIMDVTATATTEASVLGEQGAKGIQYGDKHQVNFTSEDSFGYFIVLSHVMPDTGYYQGRKRHIYHLDPFDFYTPEFDSIGLQSIRNDEL